MTIPMILEPTLLPTSPGWIADNETDVSTLYRADASTPRPPLLGGPMARDLTEWLRFTLASG
jgi:hypothetical protein